ncbi:MAG: hypothetical protein RR073_01690 [Clostridia bacterium]
MTTAKPFYKKTNKILLFIFILLFFILAILFPKSLAYGTLNGITLSINNVIPALLPFFVVTNILINSSIATKLSTYLKKPMHFLFNLPSCAALPFFIGIVGGFPIAASLVASLYAKNLLTKKQSECVLAFTNNASFAFVTSIVGTTVLRSFSLGVLLFVIQIFVSCLFGVILCKTKLSKPTDREILIITEGNISSIIISSIKSSVMSIALVCAFIAFFSGIASLLSQIQLPPFSFHSSFFIGLLEMTSGIVPYKYFALSLKNILEIYFLLSFSGACVFMQIIAMLKNTDISPKYFFLSKIITPLVGGVIIIIIFSIFKFSF